MLKTLWGLVALVSASASQAGETISFASPTGPVGSSIQGYSSGAYSVIAYGCSDITGGNCTPDELYGKSDGGSGDENGVGLAGDPSGDHEIWYAGNGTTPGIMLLVSGILSAGSAQFTMGSTTGGEVWNLFGWSGGSWVSLITDGTSDGTPQALPGFGTYSFYAFTSGGTITPGVDGRSAGNVLLGSIIVSGVPEPATWALMLLGFAGIGVAMRRRRHPLLAQLV